MNNSELNLNNKPLILEHFKSQQITNIKELTIGRERRIKDYVNQIQNGVINFCININDLQNENNFFDLKMNNQFKFNECIDKSVTAIKNDFSDLDKLYINCKNRCFDINPQSKESLDNYIEKSNKKLKPNLNPCISECIELFNGLHSRYFQYLIKSKYILIEDKGIYLEFQNYKDWEDSN